MAKKAARSYVCQSCGAVYPRWSGKCEACGEWNTLAEEISESVAPKAMGNSGKKGARINMVNLGDESGKPPPRNMTGIAELDRVTGGGLVPGSAVLIGGDPGIGKSTLLLQAGCALAEKGVRTVYVSGEESVDQVRLRSERLGLSKKPMALASATSVRDILTTVDDASLGLELMIIDSIQTMYVDNIDSAPGTVTQVRASAQEIIRVARKRGITVLFVGHVTKDGQLAGPRVLEHIVDAVLYFEGDRGHQFRILRAIKNRFGPTDEIGVFEMTQGGLQEINNPSALFLSQRQENTTGSAVLAAMEGTRPVLVEVQALVAPGGAGMPRRAVIGWDSNRLAMILAVLEARCGLHFSGSEVYLNIAGGIRIQEPAADLAVAAALISSLTDKPLPENAVYFGEVGLSGEIRPVSQTPLRLKEATRLGFDSVVSAKPPKKSKGGGMKMIELSSVHDLADILNA